MLTTVGALHTARPGVHPVWALAKGLLECVDPLKQSGRRGQYGGSANILYKQLVLFGRGPAALGLKHPPVSTEAQQWVRAVGQC